MPRKPRVKRDIKITCCSPDISDEERQANVKRFISGTARILKDVEIAKNSPFKDYPLYLYEQGVVEVFRSGALLHPKKEVENG